MISVLAAAAVAVVSPTGPSASVKVPVARLTRPAVEVAVRRAAHEACRAFGDNPEAAVDACARDAAARAMRRYDEARVRRLTLVGR